MKLIYDEEADVLYVTLAEGMRADLTIENDSGDVIRYNSSEKMVAGVTIINFRKRGRDWNLEIPEVSNGRLTAAGENLFGEFSKPSHDLLASR